MSVPETLGDGVKRVEPSPGMFPASLKLIGWQKACQDSSCPPRFLLESWRTWMFLRHLEMVSKGLKHTQECFLQIWSWLVDKKPIKTSPVVLKDIDMDVPETLWYNVKKVGTSSGIVFWSFYVYLKNSLKLVLRVLLNCLMCKFLDHLLAGTVIDRIFFSKIPVHDLLKILLIATFEQLPTWKRTNVAHS